MKVVRVAGKPATISDAQFARLLRLPADPDVVDDMRKADGDTDKLDDLYG